jgi:hypothetical protein
MQLMIDALKQAAAWPATGRVRPAAGLRDVPSPRLARAA